MDRTALQNHSTTPHLVFNGLCQGADIRRWFAILLRHHGNKTLGELCEKS